LSITLPFVVLDGGDVAAAVLGPPERVVDAGLGVGDERNAEAVGQKFEAIDDLERQGHDGEAGLVCCGADGLCLVGGRNGEQGLGFVAEQAPLETNAERAEQVDDLVLEGDAAVEALLGLAGGLAALVGDAVDAGVRAEAGRRRSCGRCRAGTGRT
jgi:hypothetical protein